MDYEDAIKHTDHKIELREYETGDESFVGLFCVDCDEHLTYIHKGD